jgi:hypothetical protein
MAAEVERCFIEDIDTLLKFEQYDLPRVLKIAQEKFHKDRNFMYAGKNKWRPGAWNFIEAKLKIYGPRMCDDLSDVEYVCTYTLYFEMAVLYLRDGSKREQYDLLIAIVSKHISALGAYITTDLADDLTEADQTIVFCAMTMCRLLLQRLQKAYPDT